MDLVIPRGARLYHGTLEDFPEKELTVGGYDSVLWTTESAPIAQSYIPCGGLGVIVSADYLDRPSQDKHVQAIQAMIGLDFGYGTSRAPSFDAGGRPTSWVHPAPWLERNDYWGNRKRISERIQAAGWEPVRSDTFEFTFSDDRLMKPGECPEGRLFVITVEQDLRVFDMTDGGEREGDLMDVDYHKLDVFREAERRGYDGVKINDFAQSKLWGNFGHTSIGVFRNSIRKLSWVAIPARNFDWPDYETLKRGMTPELEAWLAGEAMIRRNPLDLSRITVRVCKGADRTRRSSRRAYAHTFCKDGPVVCVASEFFGLPAGHRDGVLAHEIGHLLAGPDAGEEDADRAFEEETGVRVRYKDGDHGRCLQWLSPADRRSLLGRFEFEFEGRVSGTLGPDDDAVRFFVRDGYGKRELGSLREAERAAREDEDADVWAQDGKRRLGWRPLVRNV